MVEVKSKLNREIVEIASENNFKKTKKLVVILSVLFVIGGALLLVLNFDYFLTDKNDSMLPVIFGLFFLIFGALFYPNFARKYKENIDNIEKNSPLIGNGSEVVYKFDTDKFYVFVTRGEIYRSAVESDYSCILKVIEDEQKFLLVMGQNQIDVVLKRDVVSESVDELIEIFKNNVISSRYEKITAKK